MRIDPDSVASGFPEESETLTPIMREGVDRSRKELEQKQIRELIKQLSEKETEVERLRKRLSALEAQAELGECIRRALMSEWAGSRSLKSELDRPDNNSSPNEAPWVFDAPRDRHYAQDSNPAFEGVLTVFTQEWVGIRAAAGSFPGHKLAISKSIFWISEDLVRIFDQIDSLRIRTVVVHGFSFPLVEFLVALRAARPDLRICGVWHGTVAAWCLDEERLLAGKFLELASRGVFDRIHIMRKGSEALHPRAFAPLLPNLPLRTSIARTAPAWSNRPVRCIFPSWNNPWKNLYTNIAAAACSDQVGIIGTYAGVEYSGPGRDKLTRINYSDRETHLRMLASCDLALNVTVVDCHPMVEMEAISVGTPTLRANLELDFEAGHPYSKIFTTTSAHNVVGICKQISQISSVPAGEIDEIVADYRSLVVRTSFERYGEFLQS